MRKKTIVSLVTLVILLFLVIFLMVFRMKKMDSPPILVYHGWTEGAANSVLPFFVDLLEINSDGKNGSTGNPLILQKHGTTGYSDKDALFFLSYWDSPELKQEEYKLATLDNLETGSLPQAMRSLGNRESGYSALPLVLDHVELAFRRDFFMNSGLLIEDRFESLEQVFRVWETLKNETFFPLMIAGSVDRDFLDFISLIVLSTSGYRKYQNLLLEMKGFTIEGNTWTFSETSRETLNSAVNTLIDWKSRGILHPNWTSFQKNDVLSFVDSGLTASVIMRLSEHRTWSTRQLRFWQSSSFPFSSKLAGQDLRGIIAPAKMVSVYSAHPLTPQILGKMNQLLDYEAQTRAGEILSLAPVSSTANTIDREADDLRFWAAASGGILPSLYTVIHGETRDWFLSYLRERL